MATDLQIAAYLRHRIEAWLREDRTRTAAALAREAGITPTHVSTLRSEQRGVGLKAIRGLARAFGLSLAEVESNAESYAEEHPEAVGADAPRDGGTFGSLPGWDVAEAEARRKYPWIPPAAWDGARTLRGMRAPHVSADAVRSAAQLWLDLQAPADVALDAEMEARIDAQRWPRSPRGPRRK